MERREGKGGVTSLAVGSLRSGALPKSRSRDAGVMFGIRRGMDLSYNDRREEQSSPQPGSHSRKGLANLTTGGDLELKRWLRRECFDGCNGLLCLHGNPLVLAVSRADGSWKFSGLIGVGLLF